jgi:hypothetical protein
MFILGVFVTDDYMFEAFISKVLDRVHKNL